MSGRREIALLHALNDAGDEAMRCMATWPPFASAHEGYAVLYEEVDELWEEVRRREAVPEKLRLEAIHVAAMALRFAAEIGGAA